LKLSEVKKKHAEIEEMLHSDFRINHVTLQFEYDTNHSPALIHEEKD
jgi:hypothetical protein